MMHVQTWHFKICSQARLPTNNRQPNRPWAFTTCQTLNIRSFVQNVRGRRAGNGSQRERAHYLPCSNQLDRESTPGSSPPSEHATPSIIHEISPDPTSEPESQVTSLSSDLPTALDGLNWWCYTVIGLLFVTDFTPLGLLLLQGGLYTGLLLAAVQWGLFVLPTLQFCRSKGWDLKRVLLLRGCTPGWVLAGAASGALLWAVTATAIAMRTGVDLTALTAAGSGMSASGPYASPLTGLLFSELLLRPTDPGQWGTVLASSALSPAVAEELLYRGFLLTALRSRFGSWDAVALSAALFGAAHLSLSQFFSFTLLGGACGALVVFSGSLLPAVAAHAAFNSTGIAVGVAVAVVGGAAGGL